MLAGKRFCAARISAPVGHRLAFIAIASLVHTGTHNAHRDTQSLISTTQVAVEGTSPSAYAIARTPSVLLTHAHVTDNMRTAAVSRLAATIAAASTVREHSVSIGSAEGIAEGV